MELSQLYKQLAFKVHPDHGGTKREMQQLNKAYETFKTLSAKYLKAEENKTETPKSTNFRFPYPNVTFRVEDSVKVTNESGVYVAKITNISGKQGSYVFYLELDDGTTSEVIRENLNTSEDPNFYLYRARWD